MTTFLDARTSQNASLANSILVPILFICRPQLFGQIGLMTAGAETNPRVQFKGTVSVQFPFSPCWNLSAPNSMAPIAFR